MKFFLVLLLAIVFSSATGFRSSIAPCRHHPCQNGGKCRTVIDAYNRKLVAECRCRAPFTGPLCESLLQSSCDSLDCGAGICHLVDGRLDAAECTCPPGLTGPNCDEISESCATDRCNDQGDCIKDANATDGIVCSCDAGFTGPSCEIDIDECQTATCPSNKQCLDQPGGYVCVCPEGTVGPDCEYVNPCLNATAETCGNGICASTMTGDAICVCDPGWHGETCLVDIDECEFAEFDLCQTDEMCFNSPGSYKCIPRNVTAIFEFTRVYTGVDVYHLEYIFGGVFLFVLVAFVLYGAILAG